MGNSSLATYTKISPNKNSPRNHEIDTVSIHCYVGQATVESAGAWFAQSSAGCSCNYMIGSDGRIALIVEEGDRSWCTSSRSNDHRAVTIECASDAKSPYAVNDKVYASLISLLADVCQRNGIKKLLWQGDKSLIGQVEKQNMTVHRWFASKECPGDYLYNLHGQIADEVNKAMGLTTSASTATATTATAAASVPYKVKVTVSALNIRKGAGTGYGTNGSIRDKGVYTIVEEADGAGASKWGKLKSGAGWISLDHAEKV